MMTETDAAIYLNTEHSNHFTYEKDGKLETRKVSQHDVKRWIGKGAIVALTEKELDRAVQHNKIPPKRGRPSRLECSKDDIIKACETMTQGNVAKMLGCSASYVSLVVRGKR